MPGATLPGLASLRVIAFDAYSTLFDTGPALRLQAVAEVCREQGLSVQPSTLLVHCNQAAISYHQEVGAFKALDGELPPFLSFQERHTIYFRLALERLGLGGDPQAAARTFLRLYVGCALFPEVPTVLTVLQQRWQLAVVSNADDSFLLPALAQIAEATQAGLSFHPVISSEATQVYKPHPAIFQTLLQGTGCQPQEILFVGDNPYDDVQGARGVGIPVAWVNRDGGSFPSAWLPPDYEIQDLWGLLPLLRGESGESTD